MLLRGYMPRVNARPLVEWDPREYNGLADNAANLALDRGEDWTFVSAERVLQAKSEPVNYRLCFDGAKRGTGSSAAGVALLAYYFDGRRDLLFRGGKLLGKLDSAMVAECLALEWSLDLFKRVVWT